MITHLHESPVLPARVVILGAGGFVSTAVQHRLEALNVNLLPLTQDMLDLTHQGAGSKLVNLLHPDDALLFVAAKAPVKTESMLIENLRMCESVCEALRQRPVHHVAYISSDAVYADSNIPLTENSCAQPASLHGIMHLAREVMLSNAYSGPLCFIRPTLIYGSKDPHNGYGPNRFVRLALNGQEIVLFGEGEERRDHVWVNDVADLVSRVLLHSSKGILNIATGTVISFKEIAELSIHLSGGRSTIKTTERIGIMPHNGYRPFNPYSILTAFPDFRFTLPEEGLKNLVGNG